MTTTLSETVRWYENDERPCKDEEWTDIRGVTKMELSVMQNRCLFDCPVLRECRIDVLQYSDHELWGVQAGIIGRRG